MYIHLPLSDTSHSSCHSMSRRSRAFSIASCLTGATYLYNFLIVPCSSQMFAFSLARRCIGGVEDSTVAASLEIVLNPLITWTATFRCTVPIPCSMTLCNFLGLQTSVPYKRMEWSLSVSRSRLTQSMTVWILASRLSVLHPLVYHFQCLVTDYF